ncbi:MAG: ComEC family competence protein [Beijerinckiaceae bacterium]|nr:ComEC family competence protein [Beijerinckiaceae bacterium]
MEGKQHEQPRSRPSARARTAVRHADFALTPSFATRWRVLRETWARHLGAAFALEGERRSWFNWLPVAFGLGIGAYFAADRDPLWWGPIAGALLFGGAAVATSRPLARAVLIGICAAMAGMAAGQWRTERVLAPSLDRISIARLSGHVESVEQRTGDMRLVMLVTAFGTLEPARLPHRVRITLRQGTVRAGEHISLSARLMPPPEPARPGGYDFARDAFFRGIGAVGSGLGVIERSPAPWPAPVAVRVNAAIDEARNAMTERIARLIGGQAGAVAAALVTGKRGLISEETNDILRGAGIYHIVSISGLHMVLAAGAIFWLARALLALVPMLALGWPLKKIAAFLAMIGASAYCIFSGSEVATERSLIMTLIMLGAILVDRPALSMRNLAVAALVVLAMEPDAMLGPSFQMSFGAVAALIAYAEWHRRRLRPDGVEPGPVARLIRLARLGLVGMFVTSLLAGAATAPFGAFHFQTYNPFGVIGNMLALPFVSLIVMPAAVMGALLYPLGLDTLAWWIMGLATEPVLRVSALVAGLGGSTQVVPAFGLAALAGLAAALLLFTLLSTWLRWIAVIPLTTGLALAVQPVRPDIYIDREGNGVAARVDHGSLAVMGRPGAFVLGQWLKADGDSRTSDHASLPDGASCDPSGCVARLAHGHSVAWSRSPVTISEDCDRASLVVTPLRWDGACKALMVDRRTLDRYGSMSISVTVQGLVARTSRNPDAPRAWSRRETVRLDPPPVPARMAAPGERAPDPMLDPAQDPALDLRVQ